MEACSATSTSSSPAVTAPPSMLPSTSSPAASRPFAGVSAPTGTCFQDKATDGLAELLWAAQQQLVGQGHDRVGYHNADPKGKGKAQEMDPPPSLSAQQHIFGFQSHTPMQLHSTHAAAPPHCAEASLEATCCHPPHFRPDHNWTMALSSVPSSSAAQQAWADLLCCDSGHHACDIDLPCANVPCPVASTSEIPIGLAASHVALACTDPGCSEPICEPAKICCTEDVCDDEGMASVSLPACQTCPSCAGATTAQTGDNNGKVYSSFQELLDCCCCSDVHLDECCVVARSPCADVTTLCEDCTPCAADSASHPDACSLDKQRNDKPSSHPMVENQALQDAFGRPRQLSTSSPFATASSISEPFTTCHSTPGALSPRSRSASTSTSSVSSPPTAHLSRASIKDHKSLHRGALHAGMGNFGTDPKSFYQNFSQLGAQSMVPAHTSQAASSSDALGHHSEANVNCRFPYPHGHDQDGGCLPPALTLCDPSCGISGPHSPHSHGTSSLATYGATPSLAPAGALQTGHAVEQQHGATEAQTFVCQWGGCGRCWSTVEQLVAHVNEEHLVPSFTAMSQSVPWGQVSGAGYATGSSQQLLGAAGLSQQQQASIAQMTIPDQHSSSPGNLHFATCLWNDCHLVPLPESRNLTSVNGDSNSNSPNAYPNTAKTLPLLQHLLTEHLGQNVHDSWPALGNVDILSGLGNAAFSGKLDHAVQPYAKSEASKIGRKRQRLRPDTANHETNKRMRRNRNSNSGQSPDGEDHYAIAPGARTLHGSFSDSIHPTKDHPSTFGSLSLSVTPSEEAEEHSDDDDSTSEDGERVATMQAPKTVNGASTRRGGKSRDLLASSGCGCASAQPGGTGQHACGWVGCSMSFPTHEGLTEHIGSVHVGSGKAEYECGWEGCERAKEGRKFSQRQKVMRHLQTHTGDRPYKCEVCNKRFSEPNTLSQHMRTHTQERPYVCDYPGCGKAFSVAGSLTIHKRVHSGDKPFKCKFPGCDKAFAESSNLTKHARVHSGERPFACSICKKRFSRPDQVTRHRKVHEKQNGEAAHHAASNKAATAQIST